MQPIRKGTRVYTRIQRSTGSEISVRRRKQTFVLFVDNTETQEYATQEEAMQAADNMASGILIPLIQVVQREEAS